MSCPICVYDIPCRDFRCSNVHVDLWIDSDNISLENA